MKMSTKVIVALAALGVAIPGIVVSAPAANAYDCQYNKWGSNRWDGQRFDCNDGSSMYIRPPLGGSYNSTPRYSWETWQGRDTYGNNYNCNYQSFSRYWDCR